MKNKNLRKAFTLAEAIMTFVIIGIVAALTIPPAIQPLMQGIQEAKLRTGLKETSSILSHVMTKIKINHLSMKGLCADSDNTCFRDKFVENLAYQRICDSSDNYGSCWHAMDSDTKYMDGSIMSGWSGDHTGVILNNGVILDFSLEKGDCTASSHGNVQGQTYCGWITVDINGKGPPDTFGTDIFGFWILSDRIVPMGVAGDKYYNQGNNCSDTCSGLGNECGLACTAKDLLD